MMSEIKIMPPEEVEKMFARLSELRLDVSGIRRKFLNCPYGEDPKQAMDIYLPDEGGGPFPVVFFAHGGGWSSGSKNDVQLVPFIEGVKRGYAVVSVGYRLTPHVKYPENLFDIKAALRWAAQNAETYLLDSGRFALAGASAGAHLMMMAAFTHGQAAFEGARLSETYRIRAVVDQFGPTDFSKMHSHYDESGFARAQLPDLDSTTGVDIMLGVKPGSIPNLLRFINPLDNVHKDIPPVLILHGKYDPVVPYQQATELFERINAVSGRGTAELELSDTFLHADPGYANEENLERIFTFLDKYMK